MHQNRKYFLGRNTQFSLWVGGYFRRTSPVARRTVFQTLLWTSRTPTWGYLAPRCAAIFVAKYTATGELVWRGWATADLDTNPSPDRVSYYVDRAVEKILREFPP